MRLKPYVEEQNLIPDFQFGFRSRHSTTEQVHRVIGQFSTNLEAGSFCTTAFLDIRQAFDKVWHEGLIWKPQNCLPNRTVGILGSYLTERSFFVSLGSDTGLHPVEADVPQGSVLAPLLFAIFTADIPVRNDSKIVMATYADDTVMLSSDSNPAQASDKLREALNSIAEWMDQWKISVNESKSVQVTFTLKRENCPPIKMNNKTIPVKDDVKYLALHLDKRLTWRKREAAKIAKARIPKAKIPNAKIPKRPKSRKPKS